MDKLKTILIVLLFSACGLAQVLTVPNGGTGKTTFTLHGPLIGNGTGGVTSGAAGTSGQCWISNGASADPTFQACPSGGGGGTVTSFSAGNLTPLFSTSVATATSTPALSFSLTSQTANTVFGNFTGSSAGPTFNAIAACGDATHALSYVAGTGFGCQALSGSGGGITSINTDTTAAQTITGTAPISVSTASGTTTISSTARIASINTDSTAAQTLTGAGGVTITDNGTGGHTITSGMVNPVANITGTYNATAADFQTCAMKYVTSGAVIVNLVINTSQPPNGQCMMFMNYGSSTITINRNGQNINGGTNPVIVPAAGGGSAIQPNTAWIWSDGTNYFLSRGNTSIAFGQITTGSNTSATMTVGAGSTLAFTGTGAMTEPLINTGVSPNGSGMKHLRVASCTTAASANATCNTTLTWTTAFADANYTTSCEFDGTGAYVIDTSSKVAASIVVAIMNNPGVSTATSGTINCMAMHD